MKRAGAAAAMALMCACRLTAGAGAAQGRNLVPNGDFEGGLDGWHRHPGGAEIDTAVRHGGKASLRCAKPDPEAFAGVSRTLTLNQKTRKPIVISGWSRADKVTGPSNNDYAVRCAIEYTADTRHGKADVWGQCARFKTGTHDWQYAEHVFIPDHPIRWVRLYAIFRRPHTGTAWFDDVAIREATDVPFWRDEESAKPTSPPKGMKHHELAVEGLSVRIAEDGCIAGLRLGEADATDPCASRRAAWGLKHGAGLYVGDLFDGRFRPVAARCVRRGEELVQAGRVEGASLEVEAIWRTQGSAVLVEGWVKDLKGSDRAVDVVLKLPVRLDGWRWWDDLTRSREIAKAAVCARDHFPIACATHPERKLGLALALPPMLHAVYTLAYDSGAALLHARLRYAIVRDIKPHLRGRVPFAFALYPVRADWGFRDALATYYALFPEAFVRRAKGEGQWLFAIRSSRLVNPGDYAYHEGSIPQWLRGGEADRKVDTKHGIKLFPYRIPGQRSLSRLKELPADDEGAMRLLDTFKSTRKTGWSSQESLEQIRHCAVTNRDGSHTIVRRDNPGTIWPQAKPNYNVVFCVNPDPDLFADSDRKTVGKEELRWLAESLERCPDLGGVYIDSASSWVGAWHRRNHRREHFRYADVPLTYDPLDGAPVQVGRFAYIELVQELARRLHPRGYCIFPNVGSRTTHHLLYFHTDVIGVENGRLDDASMNYYRMASAQKPVLLLHFLEVPGYKIATATKEGMEKFWRKCLLYGFYPSIKGQGDQANLAYERYGYLYKPLMPILRELSSSGWEPVTHARCSPEPVRIERFGDAAKKRVCLTLYNPQSADAKVTVSAEAELLGGRRLRALTELTQRAALGAKFPVSFTIPGLDLRVVRIDLE